ncbi:MULTISPECIES: helix-turn-helix domain-containing protein [Sporomusa]|uniref:helix-turn-helix domain-containing protein n=1 Tax=Sporomusa TaxID=2375 RepID=UPI00166927ED|nr:MULTISPECIES: helix-turn-helix transcriptional regulator [Sporomusa]HML35644.1 helix-turn-helix transcriptional regulator [Sporomusa sphaeroides]
MNTFEAATPGSKIRLARSLKNMSLDTLAELSGVSRPTIARLEKDNYKRLPVDIIKKLLPYLELTMEEIKEEPPDGLAHLPDYLQQFILDPENADFLEYCYLEKRRRELEAKIQQKKENKKEP